MFWILRRTGAANFFNSLNNNCSSSKSSGSSTQDKYVKRPPRKAYGRLSAADSDDAASMKQKIDDPFDDLDNFEMITPENASHPLSPTCTQHAASYLEPSSNGKCASVGGAAANCGMSHSICNAPECQGNYVNGNNCCEFASAEGLCTATAAGTLGAANGIFKMHSSCSSNAILQSHKEINENTINRLQAMAMSDDDDYDESLTCNVCDRAFHCHRQLASHQQKKRHFGCSGCDSLFPSLMLLEHHKEEFEHWSDDEISRRVCCRRNRGDDYFTDTDSYTSEAESEDLERLL